MDRSCPVDSKNLCQSWTERQTDRVYKQSENRTDKLENKIGDIFKSGPNQCHSTGVKKSYFCHIFHLRQKSYGLGGVGSVIIG